MGIELAGAEAKQLHGVNPKGSLNEMVPSFFDIVIGYCDIHVKFE